MLVRKVVDELELLLVVRVDRPSGLLHVFVQHQRLRRVPVDVVDRAQGLRSPRPFSKVAGVPGSAVPAPVLNYNLLTLS